jgi:hypothetical protein
MEVFLWIAINAIVGAAIGARKNMVGGAVALSIFLGPIGWIIALISEGNLRKCFFCAEAVKDEAKICPHCQRELPRTGKRPPPPAPKPRRPFSAQEKRLIVIGVCVAGAILVGGLVYALISEMSDPFDASLDTTISQQSTPTQGPSSAAAPLLVSTAATGAAARPATDFVRLTDYFTLVDARGREVKTLDPGKKLRVVDRAVNEITIDYLGDKFTIPAAITEPAQ